VLPAARLRVTEGEIVRPLGRRLAYAEFGDPKGWPCFYFHFTPGSRIEPAAVFSGREELLEGVRLLAIDRPGFGRSDLQRGRSFLDWPDDVVAVADHLGIGRFAVLGLSGGGGYVLACAFKVPERLSAALILSGMGPLSQPDARKGMAAPNRIMYGLSRRAPWVVRALSWAMFRSMARRLRRPAKEGEPPGPLDLFGNPAARPALLADIDEAVLQPGTRGLVEELALYSRPWPFALEDINVDVHLWHGENDRNVPAALARYVADALPRSRATFMKGGHTAPFDRLEEAIGVVRSSAL
jgi:pimeloyl-ACP methyl ester carboxylesterase